MNAFTPSPEPKPEFLLALVISLVFLVSLSPYISLSVSLMKIGKKVFPEILEVSIWSKTNSIPLKTLLFIKAESMVFKSNSTFSYLSY